MLKEFHRLRVQILKKLKHIIGWTVWSFLALYVLLFFCLQLSPIQSFIGQSVASVLSKELGTKVTIGRVTPGLFNRIVVNDVAIDDMEHRQLLRSGRIAVIVDFLELFRGNISISSMQIFGTHIQLVRENEDANLNCQFIIDALSTEDDAEQKPLNLQVKSLIIRRSSISFEQLDSPQTPGTFNLKHMKFSDISAYLTLNVSAPDSITLNLKRLSLNEQSGLSVKKVAMKVNAAADHALLKDFEIELPNTTLRANYVTCNYDTKDLWPSLIAEGTINRSTVALADFSPFVSSLASWQEKFSIESGFSITDQRIYLHDLQAGNDEIELKASGWIATDKATPTWSTDVRRLTLSQQAMTKLSDSISGLPTFVRRLGSLDINAVASGHADGAFQASGNVISESGDLTAHIVKSADQHFKGTIEAMDVQLGSILDNSHLGNLSALMTVDGKKDNLAIQGTISRLDYKGYSYQKIDLDGHYQKNNVAGKVIIDDPNLQADIDGVMNWNKKTAVRLTGFLRNFAPKTLNISNKWGDASFGAIVDADFTASNINDAEGTIDIDDFQMTDTAEVYRLDNIHVKSGYQEDGLHYLKLNGDFGEAELIGQFDWNTLSQSFINYVAAKLPTLPMLPKHLRPSNNDFDVTLQLRNTEWLQKIFGIPLSFDHPLQLHASVDDKQHKIDVEGHLPSFSYNGGRYERGDIYITSPTDTMVCNIVVTKLMDDNKKMDLQMEALAADNHLFSSVRWTNRDEQSPMEGVVNAITTLYNNEQGQPEAHVRVQPSQLTVGSHIWEVEPSDILYSQDHLTVDHFYVRHADQHLLIDGIASKQVSDTLMVNLNKIDIAYVLQLVDFDAVSFSGKASGNTYVTAAFQKPDAWTNLTVEQFKFQDGRMGTLAANARWNDEEGQIDIHAIANDGMDAMTFVDGYISPRNDFIDLDIRARGSYIDFVHSFTDAFFGSVTGHTNGDLTLRGPLGSMNLTGELVVDGQVFVTPLNTTYTLSNDTVTFVPDDILFHRAPIKDKQGHAAYVSGGIHHQHLTNMTFDLDIEAENLLAYDFSSFGDDSFFGTVIATGSVDMHGRPGEVTINCNVTPQRGSSFTYNAANPDAISDQQFITWGESASEEQISLPSLFTDKGKQNAAIENDEQDIASDLHINFIINATPDATLRLLMDPATGDYITLNGYGSLHASYYNKGPFQMFGTYNVERGTYGITIQNIIKKNFTFQEGGAIVFGGDPFEASLNLQALYTVNSVSLSDLNIGNSFSSNTVRVNCIMNIQGIAGAPRVEFDLQMPTVNAEEYQMIRSIIANEQEINQQVVYLLGIGRFYNQGTNNAGTQEYGQTELAMQSFLSGTVSSQINELLSQVIKTDDWNFGANISTGNEGWHNAEYEGLVSGRMLNNRLLINGQFGYRDNATQTTPSFIGDFDIRYLLYPNGNLALKVYNQTNDRYFTRSSLNTQGIGLIMKKDFNSLSDLFRSHKSSKKANE